MQFGSGCCHIADKISDILYASVACAGDDGGFDMLDRAVNTLLSLVQTEVPPTLLWSMRYEQQTPVNHEGSDSNKSKHTDQVFQFPQSSPALSFDDGIITQVEQAWKSIVGADAEASPFMQFEDREGAVDDSDV